jgi:hypothetical protein
MNRPNGPRALRREWVLTGLALLLAAASGCATVSAYQREHLVDPIMSFKADARENARLTKSFDAREGSTGGNGGAGGGCACN